MLLESRGSEQLLVTSNGVIHESRPLRGDRRRISKINLEEQLTHETIHLSFRP